MDNLKLTSSRKSLSETYTLRFDSFSGWAVIVIDERGFFFCQSDWGDFTHRWDAYTDNQRDNQDIKKFKIFLTEVDAHYFLNKTYHGPDKFYEDETKVRLKKQIIQRRKDHTLDKYEARNAYLYIQGVDLYDQNTAIHALCESEHVVKAYDGDLRELAEDMVTDWPPSARFFGENVLPLFQKLLKEELGTHITDAS